jgi:hypothetical protein
MAQRLPCDPFGLARFHLIQPSFYFCFPCRFDIFVSRNICALQQLTQQLTALTFAQCRQQAADLLENRAHGFARIGWEVGSIADIDRNLLNTEVAQVGTLA